MAREVPVALTNKDTNVPWAFIRPIPEEGLEEVEIGIGAVV